MSTKKESHATKTKPRDCTLSRRNLTGGSFGVNYRKNADGSVDLYFAPNAVKYQELDCPRPRLPSLVC
jgi:hypothetical protein